MQELTELTASLKKGETSLLINFYKSHKKGEPLRRLELFNLVKEKKVKSDEEAAEKLYGTKPNSTYSHLKTRLKEDIHQIILLQDSVTKTSTPFGQAIFEARRMLTVGDILLSRGAYTSAENLLRKAGEIAEKFELAAESVLIKDLLRTRTGFKKGIKVYEKYTEEINDSLLLLKHILIAKRYSSFVGLANMFRKNKEKDYEKFAFDGMMELKEIYEKTLSPNVGYWYHRMSLFYYSIIRDYKKALGFAKELLRLIEQEIAIFSLPRKGDCNLQIAIILLNIGKYKQAVDYLLNARACYNPGMVNYLLVEEIRFIALLHDNNLQLAEETLINAFQHQRLKENRFMYGKWSYYKSALEFSRKQFSRSMSSLHENNELMKDSSGWLLGIKLLEIINLIELKEYDILSYKLTAFKQLLYRHKLENISRYKCIYSILSKLIKHDFNFKATFEKEYKNLALLETARDEYLWNATGFEIIRFDSWFKSKL